MKRISAVIAALLLGFFAPSLVSACNKNQCVAGCGAFDARLNSCNFDYQEYHTKVNCVCAGLGTVQDNERSLINCLSCNDEGLGSNTLDVYKIWAALCGDYQLNGLESAVHLGEESEKTALAYYTRTVEPVVESVCPIPDNSAGGIHNGAAAGLGWSIVLALFMA